MEIFEQKSEAHARMKNAARVRHFRKTQHLKFSTIIDNINYELDKGVLMIYPSVGSLIVNRNNMVNLVKNHKKKRMLWLDTCFNELYETRVMFADNVHDVTVDIWKWKNALKEVNHGHLSKGKVISLKPSSG